MLSKLAILKGIASFSNHSGHPGQRTTLETKTRDHAALNGPPSPPPSTAGEITT